MSGTFYSSKLEPRVQRHSGSSVFSQACKADAICVPCESGGCWGDATEERRRPWKTKPILTEHAHHQLTCKLTSALGNGAASPHRMAQAIIGYRGCHDLPRCPDPAQASKRRRQTHCHAPPGAPPASVGGLQHAAWATLPAHRTSAVRLPSNAAGSQACTPTVLG